MIPGPSFSGKTCLTVEKVKLVFIRDIFMKTRSPEQYIDEPDTEKIRKIGERESGIVIFEDMLDSSKSI